MAGCGDSGEEASEFEVVFTENLLLIVFGMLPTVVIPPAIWGYETLITKSLLPFQRQLAVTFPRGQRFMPGRGSRRARQWFVRFIYCLIIWIVLASMILAGRCLEAVRAPLTDAQTHGRTNEQTDRRTDGRTCGQTNALIGKWTQDTRMGARGGGSCYFFCLLGSAALTSA